MGMLLGRLASPGRAAIDAASRVDSHVRQTGRLAARNAKQKTRRASAKRVSCAPPDIFGLERTSL
jgi:hypothetical protein